ncbi:hypothetical protein LCGC14_1499210 [marine sediment metagenome]|uniref:Uncharacterized protein n=1 Tax=marine sediment metagenome TaxID=412755 RepID=A0A0F9J521_9ZZZZ
MSTELSDTYTGENSDCCDAAILMPDICSACKEHCETIELAEGTPLEGFIDSLNDVTDDIEELERLQTCHSTEL